MSEIEDIVESQREFFQSDKTKSVAFRLEMLKRLNSAIREREKDLFEALRLDLGKTSAESYMSEICLVYQEIKDAIRHVKAWSKPRRVRGVISTFPSANYIYSEPYGVVLILAPWNYPLNLSIIPLVDAMAAGNCALVKSSRLSTHTSALVRSILNETFPREYVYGVDPFAEYEQVLEQSYDYIFFTGSPRVGKIVMQTAGARLIPSCLELGGKCPCIVDESADLKLTAKRVVWGKLLNAGQTCISVDYMVVENRVKQALIKELQEEIDRRYPDAAHNPDYPRIISRHHYDRLCKLLDTGRNVYGGERNERELKIGPAIFPEAGFEDEIMEEEIFGPLLPIIGYDDLKEVVRIIKEREKPLALYVFTGQRERADYLLSAISSGGACVNDTIMQIANYHMPFGGVGNSGLGAYHGKFGFDTFSHKKGVVKSSLILDVPLRYAPYSPRKLSIVKKIIS